MATELLDEFCFRADRRERAMEESELALNERSDDGALRQFLEGYCFPMPWKRSTDFGSD